MKLFLLLLVVGYHSTTTECFVNMWRSQAYSLLNTEFRFPTATRSSTVLGLANRGDKAWDYQGMMDPGDDKNEDDEPSLEELFGGRGGGVQYVLDTNEQQPQLEDGTIDKALLLLERMDPSNRPVIKEIAIMPFETPLFPGAREFLYIYEMRFRSLMNDVEGAVNLLGRCFVSSTGAIGLVGSFCNIVEREKLKDGKGKRLSILFVFIHLITLTELIHYYSTTIQDFTLLKHTLVLRYVVLLKQNHTYEQK